MWINLKALSLFGGRLKSEYTYTPPEISNECFKGKKSSSFILLDTSYGFGKLSLPIVFKGEDRNDAVLKKSQFEKEIFGKADIALRDGFSYFAFLNSIGDASFPAEYLIEATYDFFCIRHGSYREVEKNSIFCESTLPHTDCVLEVVVSSDSTLYKVGTVIFSEVSAGEKLVVDGINKRILVNGAPAAERAEWIEFPYLKPGENNLACKDVLKVGYYPVYF